MGKNLVILGADFSANGIQVADANIVYPSFTYGSFVYNGNKKIYSHKNGVITSAFRLKAGITYRIKITKGTGTHVVSGFAIDDICVSSLAYLFIEPSQVSSRGTYIGQITTIRTTQAATIIPAYNDTYTPTEDCTLLVSADVNDTIEVSKES